MAEVASLFASLGIRPNVAQWKAADAWVKRIGDGLKRNDAGAKRAQSSFSGLGSGLKRLAVAGAAFWGAGKIKGALIDFNATVEDTRLQIAGMMALATKTDLNDNLSQADRTLANLSERAAKLPGTTQEYARMLGMITQPVLDAKLGMQDLEDITVSAVVAAKALGIESEVAARDIDQAIRGQFRSVDVLTGKLLGSIGFKGEEGREKFNKMKASKRAQVLKQALTQKQITQLGAAQGETFSGVLSTMQDAVQRFFAKVGLPLFKAITAQLKQWVAWLEKNSDKVEAFAKTVGSVLMKVFEVLGVVVEALIKTWQELYADEDIRAAFEAIGAAVKFIVKGFIELMRTSKLFRYVVLAPLVLIHGIFKAIVIAVRAVIAAINALYAAAYAVGSTLTNMATAIGDFFVGIGSSIKAFFVAVIDWIAAKLEWVGRKVDWVWGKVKTVGKFVGGGVGAVSSAINAVTGTSTPAVQSGAAGTASRVVPPQASGAPPNVNVALNPQIKFTGNIPPNWVDVRIQKGVQLHSENMWRHANAAVGGEEP